MEINRDLWRFVENNANDIFRTTLFVMANITISKKLNTIGTFELKGEKFVVLKKEYLDELLVLMKSFMTGERLLKERKTRSFEEFLKSISKKQ